MKNLPIQPAVQTLTNPAAAQGKGTQVGTGFSKVLNESLNSLNLSMQESEALVSGLATGQHANIHETMIAMEKAGIQLRLVTKLQNKVIEAYKEIMRMQL